MKKRNYILNLALRFVLCYCVCQIQVVPCFSFNNEWQFLRQTHNTTLDYSEVIVDESSWESITLPHTPQIEPLVVNNQWQGICWYRKYFHIEENKNKSIYLHLEAAMNVADIWINGIHKISHLGGYLPIVIDISEELNEGVNMIIVKLDNQDYTMTGPKNLSKLDFNTYGGLYRNAHLIIKDKLHISNAISENKPASGGVFVSCTEADSTRAKLLIKTDVKNAYSSQRKYRLVNELWYNGACIVKQSSKLITAKEKGGGHSEMILDIQNPHLWSHITPSLYTLHTMVISAKGDTIDRETNKVGLRKADFIDNQLYVNGKKTFLRGVNRHQEYPFIGYAISDRAQWRDAAIIKNAGFDYIRLSHYPPSPAFLDACDYYGIWVLDAIPGWQYYNPDIRFQNQVVQTARDMIRRDRNHPCVLAWEVSLNETDMPLEFVERLDQIAKEEYPNCYTAGWINHTYDIYLQARQHRNLQDVYDKPLIVSEYGDWEYYAGNAGYHQDKWEDLKAEERNSRQLLEYGEKRLLQQAKNIQESHNDNLNLQVSADGYWAMFDYNRGYSNDLEASGVMSIFRQPKLGYYFYKSQRTEIPTLKIASYWNMNSSKEIKVYSNSDSVALYLNNRLISRQKPDKDDISINLKHPPFTFSVNKFEEGELVAVGYQGNNIVLTDRVISPGSTSHLLLELDEQDIDLSYNDICIVHATVKDKNNSTVIDANGRVQFFTSGDIEIVGENPSPIKLGVASILVKTGNKRGTIEIAAEYKDLKSKMFKTID